jgi:hypothetical protein
MILQSIKSTVGTTVAKNDTTVGFHFGYWDVPFSVEAVKRGFGGIDDITP